MSVQFLVSNWNFDASITRQSLWELLTQRCIPNFITDENWQQVPLFHAAGLSFVVPGVKKKSILV